MRKKFYEGRFFFIPIGIAAFLSLFGFIVMELWNGLMPAIFHLTTITFWQAIGLLILSKILFGFGKGSKWGPGSAPWAMRHQMREQFKHMTPEQKEKFKQQMSERMCNFRYRGFDREMMDFETGTEKGSGDA